MENFKSGDLVRVIMPIGVPVFDNPCLLLHVAKDREFCYVLHQGKVENLIPCEWLKEL